MPYAKLQDQVRPLRGGLQLVWNNNSACTLGFVAVRNGVRGFITNSHCTGDQFRVTGMRYRQGSSFSSPIIGTEIAEAGNFACGSTRCRYSGSAFVRISNARSSLGKIAYLASYYSPTAEITDNYTVTGTGNSVVEQTLIKVGRTTGETFGSVSQTNVTVNTGGGILTQGSFFVQRPSGVSPMIAFQGDRGSPVFSISGKNALLHGLLYCASPYREVVRSLGTLKVKP